MPTTYTSYDQLPLPLNADDVAAGVKLGQLLDINYNWGEIELYAKTKYSVDDCLAASCAPCDIDIDPDDIQAGDTATFVWEIV